MLFILFDVYITNMTNAPSASRIHCTMFRVQCKDVTLCVLTHAEGNVGRSELKSTKGDNTMLDFLMTVMGLVHAGTTAAHGFVALTKYGNPFGFVEILIGIHTWWVYTKSILPSK